MMCTPDVTIKKNTTPCACYLLLPVDVLQSVTAAAVILSVSERQEVTCR